MKKLLRTICGVLAVTVMLPALPSMALSPSDLSQTETGISATEQVSSIIGRMDRSLLPAEEKLESTATLQDNYDPGIVLVTMTLRDTVINKPYSAADFPEIAAEKVEDLSRITSAQAARWIDEESYHQILKITLTEKTKAAVLRAIAALETRDDILCAEPDYITAMPVEESGTITSDADVMSADQAGGVATYAAKPNDTYRSKKYDADFMDLYNAWDICSGSSDVKVGIMDTGIDGEHEDLQVNFAMQDGVNFATEYMGDWNIDPDGHGTHIAGIIGGTCNNGMGAFGVCKNVRLVSIRIFKMTMNTQEGIMEAVTTDSLVVAGTNYATDHNIPIINFSGGTNNTASVSSAIANYPGLFVTAAGNEGVNIDTQGHKDYPSCFDLNNIISVTGTYNAALVGQREEFYPGYNYGPRSVDVAAPGTFIVSSFPKIICENSISHDDLYVNVGAGQKAEHIVDGYHYMSGTSMAAPQVAGIAALIKSYNRELTTEQIKYCIMESVDKLSTLTGKCRTGGSVNAYKALCMARDLKLIDRTFVSGDFNGDGKEEMAAFYGTTGRTDLVVWRKVGTSYDLAGGRRLYTCTFMDAPQTAGKVAAGDFDGDGRDEIMCLYGRGTGTGRYVEVYMFDVNNYSATCTKIGQTGSEFNADAMKNMITAGDFDGDGRDEVGALYDYGSAVKMWVFELTPSGTFFHDGYGTANQFLCSTEVCGRVTAGDFDGDGKDEITLFYSYGGDAFMKMWIFEPGDSGKLHYYVTGQTGSWNPNNINGRVTAGDYDNDGTDEVITIYDYGSYAKVWIFKRNTDGTMYHGVLGQLNSFSAAKLNGKMASGDYDGDGKEEAGGLYQYTGYCGFWMLKRTASGGLSAKLMS